MPNSLGKIQGRKNDHNPGNYRSFTWLCNTRLLVSGAVFMQKSFGSVQGFSTPVGLQLGWFEWCGARGLSMSYFTQVLREITELTSLTLSVSLNMLSATLSDFRFLSFFFCLIIFFVHVSAFLLLFSCLSIYFPLGLSPSVSPISPFFVYVVFPSWLIWINCQGLN